jgi:hypothetical protein
MDVATSIGRESEEFSVPRKPRIVKDDFGAFWAILKLQSVVRHSNDSRLFLS